MSLFAAAEAENRRTAQPLAARMRPRTLDEFVGQQHFLGEGKLLRRLIKADRLTALLFTGRLGRGKRRSPICWPVRRGLASDSLTPLPAA